MIKGYCVLTITISEYELVWRNEEFVGDEWVINPDIYSTERDAQLAIIEDIENDIYQFIDRERNFNDIHQFGEYLVSEIEINGDVMTIKEMDNPVMSLKQWRESL